MHSFDSKENTEKFHIIGYNLSNIFLCYNRDNIKQLVFVSMICNPDERSINHNYVKHFHLKTNLNQHRSCNICATFAHTMSSTTKFLENISELSHVKIRSPTDVSSKLERIKNDGPSNLRVFSDFDRTLSTNWTQDGNPAPGSCSIFCEWDPIREKLDKWNRHYVQIEFDHSLTTEEKMPIMEEWWRKSHEEIARGKITKKDISKLIDKSQLILKYGAETFFNVLKVNKIPLIIFSAGIAQVIEMVLQKSGESQDLPDHEIIANFAKIDQNDIICDFQDPLIHSFNKTSPETRKAFKSKIDKSSDRKNILVLGDSVGDANMADGLSSGEVLKIGFLNDPQPEKTEQYSEVFDIVVMTTEGNESLSVPTDVLSWLVS